MTKCSYSGVDVPAGLFTGANAAAEAKRARKAKTLDIIFKLFCVSGRFEVVCSFGCGVLVAFFDERRDLTVQEGFVPAVDFNSNKKRKIRNDGQTQFTGPSHAWPTPRYITLRRVFGTLGFNQPIKTCYKLKVLVTYSNQLVVFHTNHSLFGTALVSATVDSVLASKSPCHQSWSVQLSFKHMHFETIAVRIRERQTAGT